MNDLFKTNFLLFVLSIYTPFYVEYGNTLDEFTRFLPIDFNAKENNIDTIVVSQFFPETNSAMRTSKFGFDVNGFMNYYAEYSGDTGKLTDYSYELTKDGIISKEILFPNRLGNKITQSYFTTYSSDSLIRTTKSKETIKYLESDTFFNQLNPNRNVVEQIFFNKKKKIIKHFVDNVTTPHTSGNWYQPYERNYYYDSNERLIRVSENYIMKNTKQYSRTINTFVTHDTINDVIELVEGELTSLTDTIGDMKVRRWEKYYFDKQQRLIKEESIQNFFNPKPIVLAEYEYDKDGKLINETKNGLWYTPSLSKFKYTYNEKGLLTEKTEFDEQNKIACIYKYTYVQNK